MVTGILFFFFFALILVGVPIAMALGVASAVVLVKEGFQLNVLASHMISACNSFNLLAIPYFMFAGSIMTKGGISKRLVDFCYSMLGRLRGGLAIVATVAAAFFAAISGSNAATTAAVGSALIPEMEKKGYGREFSAATIASAGTVGAVIPPSTFMVLYAASTGVSVGKLFLGGVTPGILMVLTMIIIILILSKKHGYSGDPFRGVGYIFSTFKDALGGLLMPAIILGGIYGGLFSPTEAACIACFYGIIVSMFVYREVTIKDLWHILVDSAVSTAMVCIVLCTAGIFGWVLTIYNVPQMIAGWMTSITSSTIVLMLLINILLFIVGMFMNASAAISILSPILYPVIVAFGYDPVAFGVIMTVNLSVGCITPPVGVDLFVAGSIANVPLSKVSKAALPFIICLCLLTVLLSFFPQIITFLPSLYS